jgi:hypothetical protein
MKKSVAVLALLVAFPAEAAKITVPVDVGVGPAALTWSGAIAQDQPIHFGLSISAAAIVDQATLKKHRKKIPAQLRRQLTQMEEIRVGYLLIPDTLIVSPKQQHTSMYGATWSPISLGVPFTDGPVRIKAQGSALFTYTFIHSDDTSLGTTHFFRPGLGLGGHMEFPLGGDFHFSVAWRSGLYLPQRLGGAIDALGPILSGALAEHPEDLDLRRSIWHVGQGSAQLHYRFPVTRGF